MRIKEIKIQGFRSIYNQTIKVDDFNIFVGLNDSGKSNILKALNLFFKNETGWGEKFNFEHDFNIRSRKEYEQSKATRKQSPKIVVQLMFQSQSGEYAIWKKEWRGNEFIIEDKFDATIPAKERWETGRKFKKMSRIPNKLRKIKYIYVPAVKSPEFISSLIGMLSDVLSERSSKDIRIAASNFEKNIHEKIKSVFVDIKEELDIKSDLRLPDELNVIFSKMQFSDDNNIGLSRRGDGIRTRHIPILLTGIADLHNELKQKQADYDHFIWGYEEPENNVEIKKCYEMAKQLHEKSTRHQIFLTTHSPAFYSLPLKVNENWEQGEHGIFRYYAEYEDKKTEYTLPQNEKLDDNFLLPMVSEIIDEKNSEIDKKNKTIEELKNRNIFAKSCIFVEGESDKIIFNKTISLFFPSASDKIKIEACNGCDGVYKSLSAWQSYFYFESLKNGEKNIKRAYGYFDGDKKGIEGKEMFEKEAHAAIDYAIPLLYLKGNSDSHIFELCQQDIKIPCILEHFYPPSFWELARTKNMLEEKSLIELESILGKNTTSVIRDEEYINELLPEKFENNKGMHLLITHKFKCFEKVSAAKLIERMDESKAKECLLIFSKMIENKIEKLISY